jgi:hypothetical protein
MKIKQQPNQDSSGRKLPVHWVDVKHQTGKIGYILLWMLGVPIPVLFVIYLLRGCT